MNRNLFYAALALGVIAIILGIYFLTSTGHQKTGYAGIIVGIILLIVGVGGMFTARSRIR